MKNTVNNNLCEGVKVIKRQNKLRKLLGVILLIFALIFSVLYLASSFTDALKIGNFSFLSLFKKDNSVSGQKYYALMLGEFNTVSEATAIATSSSALGASGYVWVEGGKYYAVGSIYQEKSNAEKVMDNLTGEYSLTIHEIVFNKISLNESERNNKLIKETINYLYSVCDGLEENSIKLEKNEITQIACASFINNYRSEIQVSQSKIDYLLASELNDNLLKIKNALIQMDNSLGTTTSSVLAGKTSAMKYGFAEFVFNLKILVERL